MFARREACTSSPIALHLYSYNQISELAGFQQTDSLNLGLHNGVHVVDQIRHTDIIPIDGLHVLHHLHKTLIQLDLWLPSQSIPYTSSPILSPTSTGNIRFSFTRVILGQRHVDNLALASSELHHLLRQLLHCELDRVTEIEGADHIILLHHQNEALQITDGDNEGR